ncbi:hypothetical protein SAMN05444410_11637 [Hydrobacter penzbergensis]|uniref:Uncharacterized protein n=1 Tax=Hydrobacter penzbergensis TaxID=1235997 RepID=A0A8X8LEY2_9BACT|nr:hypothetical protein SAMN05444410_11637 [Hydrobacter penzbergensis]
MPVAGILRFLLAVPVPTSGCIFFYEFNDWKISIDNNIKKIIAA